MSIFFKKQNLNRNVIYFIRDRIKDYYSKYCGDIKNKVILSFFTQIVLKRIFFYNE